MIQLWIREDGEQPKAIAIDAKKAPGPGHVVVVDAATSAEARATLALALTEIPNEIPDASGPAHEWLRVTLARKRVRAMTAGFVFPTSGGEV